MEIRYNMTGGTRKEMAGAIGDILGIAPKYRGAPSFAYDIGDFVVDKDCVLRLDTEANRERTKTLLDSMAQRGFTLKAENEQEPVALTIEIPKANFSVQALANLERLIESKGALIKKALGVRELPIEHTEDRICFPWFSANISSDEVKAYTHFIAALCKMASMQQRVIAKPTETGNDKFSFRCLLNRLGFIGDEYKCERKVLLSKLEGDSAFRYGRRVGESVEEVTS